MTVNLKCISQKQWICWNSKYCNGRVSNHPDRKECRNCGMKIDDKRRKKSVTWIEVNRK